MGQTLSQPVTEKHSDHGEDDRLLFGISSMQGWRVTMEDAHAAVLDLKIPDSIDPQELHQEYPETPETPIDKRVSFFAVYDGHGGDQAAIFTGEKLHHIVAHQEAFAKRDFPSAMKDGFLSTDRTLLLYPPFRNDMSGCTATTAIIADGKLYVANAGDSRTVLGVKGIAKPMSFDHKPQNEGERNRIVAGGGFVDSDRVNGNLALSRAIGDFDFKKSVDKPPEEQIVTAFPDVTVHDISPNDEFLVLACDGIWDCMLSQEVVEFVRRGIAARQDLSYICENIMDNCLAPASDVSGIGCDNMTILIVGLLNGKTKEEWYDLIAERVANNDGPVAPESSAEAARPGGNEKSGDKEEEEGAYDEIFRRTVESGITLQQLLGAGARLVTTSNGSIVIDSGAKDIFGVLRGAGLSAEEEEHEEHADSEGGSSSRIEEINDTEMKDNNAVVDEKEPPKEE